MPVIGNQIFSTMWSRWLVTILIILVYQIVFLLTNSIVLLPTAEAVAFGGSRSATSSSSSGSSSGSSSRNINSNSFSDIYSRSLSIYHHRSQNYKISPKPCSISGIEGTCMFVWECIKSEGQHVGMCVDSFMFGSCCAHNLTENVIPQTFSYTRPTKPAGWERPQPVPHRPSISGMTTIERPHGAGTLVIRPSGPHHQLVHQRPSVPIVSTTTTKNPSLTNSQADLVASASIAGGIWNTSPQTTQWQMSTEPNFITKPRPPSWDKPTPMRPKPTKPTKKPIYDRPTTSPFVDATKKPSTVKPKPQVFYPKPSKPLTSSSTTTVTTTKTTTTTTTSKPTTMNTRPTTTATRPTTTSTIKPQQKPPLLSTASNHHHTTKQPTSTTNGALTSIADNLEEDFTANEVNGGPHIKTLTAAKVECGSPSLFSRPETRIVGGKNAPFGRWPWQVSVRRTSFFGFSSTHRCGGALINENWIATAGHCVDDLLTSQIRIRVGEYDFSHVQEQLPYIERGVAKKVVHPKYNFFTYEYDLALVKLEQPLEFAAHVSPICLPSTDNLLIGMNATVTGWGRLSEGGTLPSVLQEVSVPIVSNDRCKSMFLRAGRQEFIPDIFLCAGYDTGGQDSCQGDSGGPLQVKAQNGKYFLAGIISWGIGCAEANLPGVCTRISKFVPWIMETVS